MKGRAWDKARNDVRSQARLAVALLEAEARS